MFVVTYIFLNSYNIIEDDACSSQAFRGSFLVLQAPKYYILVEIDLIK